MFNLNFYHLVKKLVLNSQFLEIFYFNYLENKIRGGFAAATKSSFSVITVTTYD